ncbi:MAG: hypothetical protein L0Y44_11755 [Phycisphaerales bacterium]|nr:hypothetical protein [Phycisphaerales bacterium]MCI0677060.1 hypothetical protein [Phycisphaerales bacterium]
MNRWLLLMIVAIVCTVATGVVGVALLDRAGPARGLVDRVHDVGWTIRDGKFSEEIVIRVPVMRGTASTAQMIYELSRFPWPAGKPQAAQLTLWAKASQQFLGELKASKQFYVRIDYIGERAYGWPLRWVSDFWTHDRGTRIETLVDAYEVKVGSASFRIPTRVLWGPVGLNVLAWFVILALPLTALRILRRNYRIKRGLCPACAYPIGTSATCTECGRLLSRQPIADSRQLSEIPALTPNPPLCSLCSLWLASSRAHKPAPTKK